jgi:predicted transcriptional regulator
MSPADRYPDIHYPAIQMGTVLLLQYAISLSYCTLRIPGRTPQGGDMSTTTDPRTTLAIRLPASLKAELGALARATGRNRNALVEEAIRRLIAVEQWQIADIEAGLREAEAGDFATPEEMDQLWSKYRTPTTRTG